jgi:uncharacterized RDD family membrane protein YckC
VTLTLTLAGLGSRAVAGLLDLAVRAALLGAVALVLALADSAITSTALGVIVFALTEFALLLLYDILFETFAAGRTPGKRWSSLRVLRTDGRPVGLGTATVRNVLRLVDGLPTLYLPGMASILATRRNQRLGDLAAGTIVVREPRLPKAGAAPDEPVAPRIGTPPLPAWDVAAITAEDLATVRTFLGRREDVQPDARFELAERLAGGLAAKIPGIGTTRYDPEYLLETIVALKSRR